MRPAYEQIVAWLNINHRAWQPGTKTAQFVVYNHIGGGATRLPKPDKMTATKFNQFLCYLMRDVSKAEGRAEEEVAEEMRRIVVRQ